MLTNIALRKLAHKYSKEDQELVDFVTDPTMPDDAEYMVFPQHSGRYGKLTKQLAKLYASEFGKGATGIISAGNGKPWHAAGDALQESAISADSKTVAALRKLERELGGAGVSFRKDDKNNMNLSVFPQIYDWEIGAETPDEYDFSELANVTLAKAPKKFDKLHLKHQWYGKDADDFGVDSYAMVKGKKIPLDIAEKDLDKYENTMRRIRLRHKFKKLNFSMDPEGNYEVEYKY